MRRILARRLADVVHATPASRRMPRQQGVPAWYRAGIALASLVHPPTRVPITNASDRIPYQCISAVKAAELLRQEVSLTVFDVRDLVSYRQGHIEGAAQLSEDRVLAWVKRLPKEQPVLIYCYHGNASQTYAQMFSDFRFQRVFSVDGGYEKLLAALA